MNNSTAQAATAVGPPLFADYFQEASALGLGQPGGAVDPRACDGWIIGSIAADQVLEVVGSQLRIAYGGGPFENHLRFVVIIAVRPGSHQPLHQVGFASRFPVESEDALQALARMRGGYAFQDDLKRAKECGPLSRIALVEVPSLNSSIIVHIQRGHSAIGIELSKRRTAFPLASESLISMRRCHASAEAGLPVQS
jgi:hypothetical protein